MDEAPLILEVEFIVDTHRHLRENVGVMDGVVEDLVATVIDARIDAVLAMPNLKKPITTALEALNYTSMLRRRVPPGKILNFIPCAQITEQTTVAEIIILAKAGVYDFKVYPRDRTTNSEFGVIQYYILVDLIREAAAAVWEEKGKHIRVHLHPEHPSLIFTNHEAEFAFLPIAYMLIQNTEAIVIWEHGTDARCIPHWKFMAKSGHFYVTLTAHHLATDEDKTFGDVRAACKPIIKTPTDRELLVALIMEDLPWVLAGSDDAPYDIKAKHVSDGRCACGACVGPFLVLVYAHALDALLHQEGGQGVFVNFISRNARKLYDLPPASGKFKIARSRFRMPPSIVVGCWSVELFWAMQWLEWSFAE